MVYICKKQVQADMLKRSINSKEPSKRYERQGDMLFQYRGSFVAMKTNKVAMKIIKFIENVQHMQRKQVFVYLHFVIQSQVKGSVLVLV